MIPAVDTPAAAAVSRRASRPASSTPAALNACWAARAASASVIGISGGIAFHVGELARLVLGDQHVDDFVECPAGQHLVELVKREVYAVVGDAALRKVVGADALRAIAGADLALRAWARALSAFSRSIS